MVLAKDTRIYNLDGRKVAVPLYKFQRDWIQDRSVLKIGNMSRQIGKRN